MTHPAQACRICTHMLRAVTWNNVERFWDCPCHGSRFEPDRAVIAGRAESPLELIDLKYAPRPALLPCLCGLLLMSSFASFVLFASS